MSDQELSREILKLKEVVAALRHPETGCPWDLEQTHKSLIKYAIEESYEFAQAVENDDPNEMKDELGDILLQVVLHSQLASEKSNFNLVDVIKGISDKMIRRHPHVFSDEQDKSIKGIKEKWEEIKAQEKRLKAQSTDNQYEIDSDLLCFPALTSAFKIGKKTSKINFDWENYSQVMYKVEEEWQELKEELAPEKYNKQRVQEELGDFLFSSAQLARHLGIDPEIALRDANVKFKQRFNKVEDIAKLRGIKIEQSSQEELEQLWQEVKKREVE